MAKKSTMKKTDKKQGGSGSQIASVLAAMFIGFLAAGLSFVIMISVCVEMECLPVILFGPFASVLVGFAVFVVSLIFFLVRDSKAAKEKKKANKK